MHDSLPFNENKQLAILGHMLVDPKFFLLSRSLIKPEWFKNPHCELVYKAMLAWYAKWGRPGTPDEIRDGPDVGGEEPSTRVKLVDKTKQAIKETANFNLDALSSELTNWLKARIFYTATHKAEDDFNRERYGEAYRVMDQALKEIKEASFVRDRVESFANWRADLEQDAMERKEAMTFGLKSVDDLLLPENEGGSLLRGDTTILLAPTNVGKTTTMISIAMANVRNLKRILFITHEGRKQDIKDKMRRCFMEVDGRELFELPRTEEGVARLERAALVMDSLIDYVSYNKAGLTVEEMEAFIRRRQEEEMAKHDGKGYDMLVVDYPAKLTSVMAKGGQMNKRTLDEIVYGYYIQLALEYNFHALLAIQTNREGAKVNKGQKDERRLLVMEDVHESYGVMQEATNVITLNRDALSKARGRMTFHLDKSRSSETGFAVVARTDFAKAITHSNKLGSIWYRGVSTASDKVEEFLKNPELNGKDIDPLAILGE